jgi:hypothetical protein
VLRLKAAFAGTAGTAVGGDPVAIAGLRAHEMAALHSLGIATIIAPNAVDQKAHWKPLVHAMIDRTPAKC